MYDFYYGYLKNKYGSKLRLLMPDTDSLCIEVKCGDFYKDMKEDSDKYDTSDFSPYHPYGIELKKKKVPGLFTEFVGLRSKLYSFRTRVARDSKTGTVDEEEKKVCKEIKKSVDKKT